ncbi:MAG: AAA family ATPase, partial [Pseudonocardiales bacterium]|nr:AAA family ATPase [Pseudonocardiales bacterium]
MTMTASAIRCPVVRGRQSAARSTVASVTGAVPGSTGLAAAHDGEPQLKIARSSAEPFVGREEARAELQSALAAARAGHPQVVIVEGQAGIGKTTLVQRFLDDHRDVHLQRANGEQWEALVPFGVADQLFRTVGQAGTSVYAARDNVLPVEEPVSVGSRLLMLWGEFEDDEPVITVLDDAQWADLDSLRAILFAIRRVVAERVLVLLVVRSEDMQRIPDGFRRLGDGPSGRIVELEPLDVTEVQALTEGLGVKALPPSVVRLLQEHTEGNPLYIRAILEETPEGDWSTWKSALPAPAAFRRQVHRRLEACPLPGRQLVEAAAVLGLHTTLATAAAVAGVSESLTALDWALRSSLLAAVGSGDGVVGIEFPHPLIRAAVRQQLSP